MSGEYWYDPAHDCADHCRMCKPPKWLVGSGFAKHRKTIRNLCRLFVAKYSFRMYLMCGSGPTKKNFEEEAIQWLLPVAGLPEDELRRIVGEAME